MPRFNTLVFTGMMVAFLGAQLAPAQTSSVANLIVQSGNGQVLCTLPGCTLQSWQPISVKAVDSKGNPVGGATVTWTVTAGGITLGGASSTTSLTAGNGIATQNPTETIFSNFASPGTSYLVNNIQATSNNISVTFTETQDLINATTPSSEIEANPPQFNGQNLSDATLNANVGTTLNTPIQVQVAGLDIASNGVPNVSVRIVNQQTSPTLSCANQGGYADPGSVLTNAQGFATCYPVFAGSGTGTFYILIGGVPAADINSALYLQEYPANSGNLTGYTFTSNPGTPTAFQIVSGNNQVGNIGSPLSPLVAKLVDSGGNPVQGQTVVWTVVPAGAVGLGNGPFVTDNNGQVSISVTLDLLASAGAAITVALQNNPNIAVTFQESVQGALTAMNKISGDNQTAQPGANFASPLVVQVVSATGPVANYPVQFLVSGPVSLSATTVGTDGTGTASVTVKAGSIAGTATVTAVAGALTKAFTLTVSSGPTPTGLTVVSGTPQSAVIGTAFTQPLVVQVAGVSSGYTVGFSSTGPITLSSGAASTNSSGQAQINVTAGATPGPATVTATISGFQTVFNLTVTPSGPQISSSSFLNAASRQVGALSPCSLAILTAAGLTPDSGSADFTAGPVFGRWPKSVNRLSVTFNGIPAPIKSVVQGASNPEVTLQVPCEVTPASNVPVVVNVNGGGTATTSVTITAVSPGIFQQVMSDGVTRAVTMRSDGSFADVGNPDQYDPNNPARLGEVVRFYLTGLGGTTPLVGTDSIENPNAYLFGQDAVVNGTVTASFVGTSISMPIVSMRQAPGQIGVYEIQVTIPDNAPTGNNVQFTIAITPTGSTTSTAPTSTVAIGQ